MADLQGRISSSFPASTYRLQFGAGFRLRDAERLVGYLSDLGITTVYASPLFRAREQSSHGYDVVDYDVIDPSIGTEDDFGAFCGELQRHGMGLMMDAVPNHMGIDDWHNRWWQDVLANGPSSRYSKYFDIDWSPPKETLKDRILLPFLGDQFGKVLENQELTLVYDDGRFRVLYYDRRFPIAPRSSLLILRLALEHLSRELAPEDPHRMEFESVMTAIGNLPPRTTHDPEQSEIRRREAEVIRRRLATLSSVNVPVRRSIAAAVTELNGRRGNPASFDRLEELLSDQVYRLCYWRVASDEINYRRFFDINALAAVRVEDPEVFRAVHSLIVRFFQRGWISGLRIDHPDGLLDPQQYMADLNGRLREACEENGGAQSSADPVPQAPCWPLYVVVEKILTRDEELPADWPVCGTTGYDFLNLVSGMLVDQRGVRQLTDAYTRFTDQPRAFRDVLYQSKRTILSTSMASELYVLTGNLERIAEQHRWSRDFTRTALRRVLAEVIACFAVYRTYIRPATGRVREEDRQQILSAIRAAQHRNPALSPATFDFLASVLLLEYPEGLREEDRQQRMQFVLKFQQMTGPVMAKGMEDTAFYRWYPLAAMAEVGGDPSSHGISVGRFHQRIAQRVEHWPCSLLATATHDTKRGEDVRARLLAISEVPEVWEQAIRRWQSCNESCRVEVDGLRVPDANEEYLLYQTVVGTWPIPLPDPGAWNTYVERIAAYMEKALREAKLHTSWANPDGLYEQGVKAFLRGILDKRRSPRFLQDLATFVESIADAGWINGLAQCVLKICAPGVPDFYQGTDLWDFHLVDPDNRSPVDFERRATLLSELRMRAYADLSGLVKELMAEWPDERLKMLVIWRGLELRRRHRNVFLEGSYQPLSSEGPRSGHVCSFVREHGGRWVMAVVPRSVAGVNRAEFSAWWDATSLQLPDNAPRHWRHIITGQSVLATNGDSATGMLRLIDVFSQFPVAILEGTE
jgi:(1->4)-alpha-D-glucan 1-alpha-D-glucosylmutase